MTITEEDGVLIDDCGNRATIGYWGSFAEAERVLKTLEFCSNCSNCSNLKENAPLAMPPVPVIANIHQAVYKAASQPGALDMRTWHTCSTTHCRAGWVTTLAGEVGKELERRTDTLFAAMQIYEASGYLISPVRFCDTDEKAMADMKRLAEEEAALSM